MSKIDGQSINVEDLSNSLVEIKPGYWTTGNDQSTDVSYPESHHSILADNQNQSFWYLHRAKCLKIVLSKFPCEYLLDVGGSNGQLTENLGEVTRVALLEPSKSGAINAMDRGIHPVIQASFNEADLKSKSVAAIGLFDVLEHIEKDEDFLIKIKHSLKEDGRLYITVPAYQSLWSQFDVTVGHFRRYNKRTLIKRLKAVGFEIEYFTYLYYLLPIPIWVLRKLRGNKKVENADIKMHKKKNGIVGKILSFFLSVEYFFIRITLTIPFGSSCMCVAKNVIKK